MKRGTPEHPKMMALAEYLGVPRLMAVGIMETLWHWTAKYAPRGDIGKYSDLVIAKQIGWDGDASKLISALITARWVDTDAEFRLLIHDWEDHADEAVKKTLNRHKLTFIGRRSNVVQITAQVCPDSVETASRQGEDEGATVSPKVRLGLARLGNNSSPEEISIFEKWVASRISAHPKKTDKHLNEQALIRRFAGDAPARAKFEKHHDLWCATDIWREKHGNFAPKLWRWVEDDAWLYPPARDSPNAATAPRPLGKPKTAEELL